MAEDTTGGAERVERLKNQINRGRGADKVAAFDPAAAPLGADDEAAGTPPSQEALALAREAEDRAGARRADALTESGDTHYPSRQAVPERRARRWTAAVAVAVAAVIVLWALL